MVQGFPVNKFALKSEAGGGTVSDAVYDASWNGNTTTAPSKNAVYDKIETLGGGSAYTVTSVTSATYNEAATANETILLCNCASNDITVNLPTAVGNTATFQIKKIDSTANEVTIDPFSTQTIDEETSLIISYQNSSVTLKSNGVNWVII